MSIPLVGCDAIKRLGLFSISLPTTNFCWFPPESASASVSLPGVRTSKFSITIFEFTDASLNFIL